MKTMDEIARDVYNQAQNAMPDLAFGDEIEADSLWNDKYTLTDTVGQMAYDSILENGLEYKDDYITLMTAIGLLAVERRHEAMVEAAEEIIDFTNEH